MVEDNMPNIPSNFDEAVQMAISDSVKHLNALAESLFAGIAAERAAHNLDYAKKMGYDQAAIDAANDVYEEAAMDAYAFKLALEPEYVSGKLCWNSGYQYDDYGNEFWVNVIYRPRHFVYEVVHHREDTTLECGAHRNFADAMAQASRLTFGEAVDVTEVDDIIACLPTYQDEDADELIEINGESISVKTYVSHILEKVSHA